MTKKIAGQMEDIGGHIDQFAGIDIRKKVMEGGDKVATLSDMRQLALWVKDAMDRLDASTDPTKGEQIMLACGHNCIEISSRPMQMAKSRHQKYPTEEAFLQAAFQNAANGVRAEMHANRAITNLSPLCQLVPPFHRAPKSIEACICNDIFCSFSPGCFLTRHPKSQSHLPKTSQMLAEVLESLAIVADIEWLLTGSHYEIVLIQDGTMRHSQGKNCARGPLLSNRGVGCVEVTSVCCWARVQTKRFARCVWRPATGRNKHSA